MKISRKEIRKLVRESLEERGMVPMMSEDESSSHVKDEVLDHMINTLWEDALNTAAVYGVEDGWLTDPEAQIEDKKNEIPQEAKDEAEKILDEFEKLNDKSIGEIAEELDTTEYDMLGYYIVMQALGEGVSWSDSREGALDVPLVDTGILLVVAEDALRNQEDITESWNLN
jgi:hypothetical protein